MELVLNAEKAQKAGLVITVKPRATQEQIKEQATYWEKAGISGNLVDAQLAWMQGSDVIGKVPNYPYPFDLGMYTHNSEMLLLFVRTNSKSALFKAIVDFATDADIGYDDWV